MDADRPQNASCAVRVFNIYATPWRFNDKLQGNEGTPTDLSGLEKHYELYKEQLPQLLPDRVLGDLKLCGDVTLAREVKGVIVESAKAELFTLPSKQVVLAVTMCLAGGVLTDERAAEPIVEVLEQCIDGDINIDNQLVTGVLSAAFAKLTDDKNDKKKFSKDTPSGKDTPNGPLLPERHQLVFVGGSEQPVPSPGVIDKILYRSKPPYRREFVTPRRPKQLNSPFEQPVDEAARAVQSVDLP